MQQTDPLEALDTVVGELEEHCERLQHLADDQELTSATVAREMVDTVMSIMKDGLAAALESIVMLREYLHDEVEPALQDLADPDSQLTPEDAAVLREQLTVLRELLDKAAKIHDASTPEGKSALEVVAMRQKRLDAVFARIEEIELREDDEEQASGLQLAPAPPPPAQLPSAPAPAPAPSEGTPAEPA